MRAWGYVFVVLYTSLQGWLVSSAPLVPSESVGAKSDSCRVHTFYYMWYGEPKTDGKYLHWNHEVLPHWRVKENMKYNSIIGRRFEPPDEVHSPFYPERGPYSSSDPTVLDSHMKDMKKAGICMAVLSWWGQADREATHDTQGVQTDLVIEHVIKAAERSGISVSFHLEPYHGRSASSVLEDVDYLMKRFGDSNALYRASDGRPMFYVYDSYHVGSIDWKNAFAAVRGTDADFIAIALWLNGDGGPLAKEGGFDGVYTYFASESFSHGSTTKNWKNIKRFCSENNLLFIPSVGPGYDDRGIRPWNFHNSKSREEGKYYDRMWKSAIESEPDAVSITSFNEWGEGTQIEAAVPKSIRGTQVNIVDPTQRHEGEDAREYKSYESEGSPNYYLDRTRYWGKKLYQFEKKKRQRIPLLEREKAREKLEAEGLAKLEL